MAVPSHHLIRTELLNWEKKNHNTKINVYCFVFLCICQHLGDYLWFWVAGAWSMEPSPMHQYSSDRIPGFVPIPMLWASFTIPWCDRPSIKAMFGFCQWPKYATSHRGKYISDDATNHHQYLMNKHIAGFTIAWSTMVSQPSQPFQIRNYSIICPLYISEWAVSGALLPDWCHLWTFPHNSERWQSNMAWLFDRCDIYVYLFHAHYHEKSFVCSSNNSSWRQMVFSRNRHHNMHVERLTLGKTYR